MNRNIIDQMTEGYVPDREELTELLKGGSDEYLFEKANELTMRVKGKKVDIRAILEFSSYCRCRCIYCGLRADNANAQRYRISADDIVNTTLEAAQAGYRTIVLQSGEDPFYTEEIICDIVRRIKAGSDIAITLSIGERPYSELSSMREAGADRFLLKHETSDPELYEHIHRGDHLSDRTGCQKNLKALGYETGGGFMIGLPGQTLDTIAGDLLLIREIGCEMAGIGPFISHEQTPLAGEKNGDPLLTRRTVALARLLLPSANLPATTSLGVIDRSQLDLIFSNGANVIMRKVTPWSERTKYEIYPTNFGEEKDILTARKELEQYIESLDRIPV